MQYRRAYQKGGCYFFTLATNKRQKIFQHNSNIQILRKAFQHIINKRPFVINAIVILPNHLHCIWTLPSSDHDFSTRWRLIKTWFTKNSKLKQSIWQNRFWEHLIKDENDFQQHIEYIHYNPVKHGYVSYPADWPYSSFHRYVSNKIYSKNWGQSDILLPDNIGKE